VKDRNPVNGFNRFLNHFRKDVTQWIFFMLTLLTFRIAFILFFRNKIGAATPFSDVLLTALNGLRYDSMVSTYWALVPFLAGAASGIVGLDRTVDTIRRAFGMAFIMLTSIAWVFTFVYFREFGDQFNHFIFNLYYDDTTAILQTIWAAYHPIPVFIVISAVIAALLALRKRFIQTGPALKEALSTRFFPLTVRVLISLLILSLLVVAARGSTGRRPTQRKDAGISRDELLNKAVLNPFFSLLYAVQDHRKQIGPMGLERFLPDRNVKKAAQEAFSQPSSFNDLDEYLKKRARGPKGVPPRHIFLVVMESYDAWPFLKKYASLGLTPNLSDFGKRGIHIENFLPASDGTMQSLTAIMTGIPFAEIEINYQPTALRPYPSSLPETFKRLGYRTRLFYGGYLSWQRFGDFAQNQGVEEVYGAPHMSRGVSTHEWGVDDEYLFDFVVSKLDDKTPSFNIIMTTSYHPPYNIDVWGKGFPHRSVPADLAPMFDSASSLKMLGHLWYSDKCLGGFVRKTEAALPRPLFAFTGDHFGRKFINANPDFFERSAVPFILYGPDVLRGQRMPRDVAGSHIDIAPTLIELTAPKGFTYYAVGQDLLMPRKEFLGIGWYRVISKDFILYVSGPPKFFPLPGRELPKDLPDMNELKSKFDRLYGIGWWRVKKGEKL
jgi:phosphoglycerol transferase MdoB-like AlkP superfamily enzyme